MNKLSKLILMLPLALAPLAGQAAPKGGSHAALAAGFVAPPDSVQTSVYWYWLSGNVSKEGVVKDLEAMKRAGINRAFIGNIGLGELATPYAPVKLFTDEWWWLLRSKLFSPFGKPDLSDQYYRMLVYSNHSNGIGICFGILFET